MKLLRITNLKRKGFLLGCVYSIKHNIFNIVNIFLSIIELSGQDANSICKSLLDLLESNGIDDKYLEKKLITFTSDGATVMMGAIKGVGTILKSKYPQIALWCCLNHRLELAVSDTIKAVGGTQPIVDFFLQHLYNLFSVRQNAKRSENYCCRNRCSAA